MLNPLHEQRSSTPDSLNILKSTHKKIGSVSHLPFCSTPCSDAVMSKGESAEILIVLGFTGVVY